MLVIILILSTLVLFFVAPILALKRYYVPGKLSFVSNAMWFFITVVTWPLVPIILTWRNNDKFLILSFWISFFVWIVATCYWLVLNVHQVIEFEQRYQAYIHSLF